MDESSKSFYVPGRGNNDKPRLMLIGEAPGRIENAKRKPFVGPAGQKLTEFLKEHNINEYDTWITNVVKHWPRDFNGRTRAPTALEIEASRPEIEDEILTVKPDIIALLGRTAIRTFFPNEQHVYQVNGKVLTHPMGMFMPLYHPASALYPNSPRQRAQIKEGYLKLGELYHGPH